MKPESVVTYDPISWRGREVFPPGSEGVAPTQRSPCSIAEACQFWFDEVETFRRAEDAILADGKALGVDVPWHRTAIAQLIAVGEGLLWQVKDSELRSLDFTRDDIKATLKSLRISDRCSYENTSTTESRKALIEALAPKV